jgi:hypothetical protein
LFQPPKAIFNQPTAAQADPIAGLASGSAVHRLLLRPLSFFVT